MQDKFVLRAMRKVAAIGTGVAMLGATLTGALALDLKDYPAPFVAGGVYDSANALVVGDNALAADTLGMVDIATNLQFLSKKEVSTGGQSVSVSGGQAKAVPLGRGVSNTSYFDAQVDDSDIETLFDGEINWKGTAYDTSEELQMHDGLDPVAATSLSSSDDDYKSDVFLETNKDKIRYAYRFDESVNLSSVSSSNPLTIDFLGTTMKITAVSSASQFDAYVGESHFLKAGDSVTVSGKVVKLIDVSSSSVAVEVDGVQAIVESGSPKIVNGIEVTVDQLFSRTNLADSSASLVLGKQSSETYKDGDAYVGEDEDDPDWVWDIAGMLSAGNSGYTEARLGGTTADKVLRVENDFAWLDKGDSPAGVGGCINLPNDFLSICLDSLTVAEDDYMTLTLEQEDSADFSDVNASYTSVKALHVSASADDALELPAYADPNVANNTVLVRAKEMWFFTETGGLQMNGSGDFGAKRGTNVLYKDKSSTKIKYHGHVVNSSTTAVAAAINFGNTKGSGTDGNVLLLLNMSSVADVENLTVTLDVNGDTPSSQLGDASDNLVTLWTASSGRVNSLGATADTEEGAELKWGASSTNLGTKDEDHRSLYGIVIKNPKSKGASDKVELLIPGDQVMANVVIKGKSASVSSGGKAFVPAEVTPKTMLASEVSDPTKYNLVVVGGPCANPLANSVFGLTCDGWSYEEGQAVVRLVQNGEKVALLVAGTSALDTRRAAKAVANSAKYGLKGTEAMVSGATLDDITVE